MCGWVGVWGVGGGGGAVAFKKTNQNTQEVKNERFLISTMQSSVRIFGIRCL